ncbi:MAG: HipA domain-containing protein [Candidatus Delongbacteria bacterium]|nr:HipA domain-containing protein [Candidatus Delongbacteria bacterium]
MTGGATGNTSDLKILLHGRRIATISRLADDRNLLVLEDDYIQNPDRPTLGLGFMDQAGELLTEFHPTRMRLHPFFSNLLPEGALREYLAKRAGVKSSREFFLLAVLGKDLPGALTVEARELDDVFTLLSAQERGTVESGSANSPSRMRFSLAGVQLKFSAILEAAGGLTIPAEGVGGNWIIKLPSALYARVPENEYSMLELARHIGMQVPEVRLIPAREIEGLPIGMEDFAGQALAVRRFDRAGDGSPIHIEDFAQVYGVYPEAKYEKASCQSLARVLWRDSGGDDLAELVSRLVFNALIGNADMHLKNWSLIYPDQRHPRLAPCYDFVSTIAWIPDDREMALSLAGTRSMLDLSWDTLERFAAKARIPRELVLAAADRTVQAFIETWRKHRQDLPLDERHADRIDAHSQSIPLLRTARPK